MKRSERGDVETVVLVIAIVVIVAMFVIFVAAFIFMHDKCKQYDDTPISEVPAKCINWRGGTY